MVETNNTSQIQPAADTANAALFNALRSSFWILKVVMILVVLYYLASGAFQVPPDEVVLVTRYGKVLGTGPDRELKQGLHWSWPWPINGHIRVPKGKARTVACKFWFQMTEQEQLQGKSGAAGMSLVPGKDDFLLTGDANILHVNMIVYYSIVDAYEYVRCFPDAAKWDPNTNPDLQPEAGLIDRMGSSAIIQAAGQFKVDDLLGSEKTRFAAMVKDNLQRRLRAMNCGLELQNVLIGKIEPPRQVMTDFNNVLGAWQERQRAIVTATGDATQKLTQTAGVGYEELTTAIDTERKLQAGADVAKAEAASKKVSQMLDQSQGSVQEILAQAKNYRTRVVESAKAEAMYMQELLPKYLQNPRVVQTRLLLGMLEETLGKVRKWYMPKDVSDIRIQIDRDPEELADQENKPAGQ